MSASVRVTKLSCGCAAGVPSDGAGEVAFFIRCPIHTSAVELLREAVELMPLGTKARAVWVERASRMLAEAKESGL